MDQSANRLIDTVKNTADAVRETVTEATREGAKKLSSRREISRLNSEVLRLRAEIEKLYTEAGRSGYQLHTAEVEQDCGEHQLQMESLYAEISEKKARSSELLRQIELLSGGMVCAECGRICPVDFTYCPSCGTKLAPQMEQTEAEGTPEQESEGENL